jgi:hypothetical protein
MSTPRKPPRPPRPAARRKGMMSVNPPFEVTAALGGYRTRTLTEAVRITAQLLGEAAVEVASMFSPDEWWVLAEAYADRLIEPENPSPGYTLARLVERAQSRYRVAEKLASLSEGGAGKDANNGHKVVAALARRLERLSYLHAWAVIVACQVRQAHYHELKPGDPWWDLAFRRNFIKPRQAAEDEED